MPSVPSLLQTISHSHISSSTLLTLSCYGSADLDSLTWISQMCALSWVTLARHSWASEGGQVGLTMLLFLIMLLAASMRHAAAGRQFYEGAMVHKRQNPALQLTSPFVYLYFPLDFFSIFCSLPSCLLLLSIHLLLFLPLCHSIAILRYVSHVESDPLVLNHLILCQIISYYPPHLAILILFYLALFPRQIQSPGGCSCRYFLSFAGLPHREGDCCAACISDRNCVCVYVDLI
jgi:hypothetical protein